MPVTCRRAAAAAAAVASAAAFVLGAEPPPRSCSTAATEAQRLTDGIASDRRLADRISTLVDDAAASGEVPAARLQAIAADAVNSLDESGAALESLDGQVGEGLTADRLPRQAQAWRQAAIEAGRARGVLRDAIRRQGPMWFMASGTGPRVLYEAIDAYEHAVDSVGLIASPQVIATLEQGWAARRIDPDTPPPPSPSLDPALEGIRARRGYEIRMKNAGRGIKAAGALGARQIPQARQLAAQMRTVLQDAPAALASLDSLVAACRQPTAKPQPRPKQGMKASTRVPLVLGIAAAGAAGGLVAARAAGGTSAGGSGGGSTASPTIVSFTQWLCSGNSCAGDLTINFPMVMNKGVITVGTNSLFLGQATVSPTSPPGNVLFHMTKSPYVTCYGTQTTVAIWNGPTIDSGPAMFQLASNIPVTCRTADE
jgi:hypothetical protein